MGEHEELRVGPGPVVVLVVGALAVFGLVSLVGWVLGLVVGMVKLVLLVGIVALVASAVTGIARAGR